MTDYQIILETQISIACWNSGEVEKKFPLWAYVGITHQTQWGRSGEGLLGDVKLEELLYKFPGFSRKEPICQ